MAEIIDKTDLPSATQAAELVDVMVAAANAAASRVAPCLGWTGTTPNQPAPTDAQLAEARLILIGAVVRWSASGSGAFTQQTAGPYSVSVDTRQRGGYRLWPSDISDLQAICKGADDAPKAFSVDTAGTALNVHADWCDRAWGALDCSCGTILAGHPIYEA